MKFRIGDTIGNLTIVGESFTKTGRRLAVVKCSKHPNIQPYVIWMKQLAKGQCKQCAIDNHKTHGLYHTKIYTTFSNIIQRVKNPNHPAFINYGKRGIHIDPRYDPEIMENFEKAFLNFYNDIQNLLTENTNDIPGDLTVDRKNNNKGYWPSNMRLAPYEIQGQNTRLTKLSPQIVKQMRTDWNSRTYKTKKELWQRKYQSVCTYAAVKDVLSGRTWKNIK